MLARIMEPWFAGCLRARSGSPRRGQRQRLSLADGVYALNPTTGVAVGAATFAGQVESSPAVSHGIVYVGSKDDKVYAFKPLAFTSAEPRIRAASPSGWLALTLVAPQRWILASTATVRSEHQSRRLDAPLIRS